MFYWFQSCLIEKGQFLNGWFDNYFDKKQKWNLHSKWKSNMVLCQPSGNTFFKYFAVTVLHIHLHKPLRCIDWGPWQTSKKVLFAKTHAVFQQITPGLLMFDKVLIMPLKPVIAKSWPFFICWTILLIKQYENVTIKNY